jgi:hypothetical protein
MHCDLNSSTGQVNKEEQARIEVRSGATSRRVVPASGAVARAI